jgi:cathepsin D
MNFLLDTGSSAVWFPNETCPTDTCPQQRFKTKKSKTYKPSTKHQAISYGKGSINGVLAEDSISISSQKDLPKETINHFEYLSV